MTNLFTEIRTLKSEGKLHQKLLKSTRTLFIISTILLLVVSFNIIFRDLNIFLATAFSVIGFLLGLYVFSQMNVVHWNEDEEVLKSGKMDKVGYIALALYIVFEISLRSFLKEYFPASVIPLLLAGIFGTLLGRAIGTLLEIHSVYRKRHN